LETWRSLRELFPNKSFSPLAVTIYLDLFGCFGRFPAGVDIVDAGAFVFFVLIFYPYALRVYFIAVQDFKPIIY